MTAVALQIALRLWPYILAGSVILGGLAWVDDRAYSSGVAAAEARQAAEVQRQREATQRAQYGAAQRVAEMDTRRRAAEDREREIINATSGLDAACLPDDILRAIGAVGRQP